MVGNIALGFVFGPLLGLVIGLVIVKLKEQNETPSDKQQ